MKSNRLSISYRQLLCHPCQILGYRAIEIEFFTGAVKGWELPGRLRQTAMTSGLVSTVIRELVARPNFMPAHGRAPSPLLLGLFLRPKSLCALPHKAPNPINPALVTTKRYFQFPPLAPTLTERYKTTQRDTS